MKTRNVLFYVAMGIALIFATACTKEDLDKALDETLENALGTNMEYITGEWKGEYKLKRNDEQVKVQEGTVTVLQIWRQVNSCLICAICPIFVLRLKGIN